VLLNDELFAADPTTTAYELNGVTVILFLYPKPPPPPPAPKVVPLTPLPPPPTVTTETLVTPAGATHEKVPAVT
jgi:hypothetical protein